MDTLNYQSLHLMGEIFNDDVKTITLPGKESSGVLQACIIGFFINCWCYRYWKTKSQLKQLLSTGDM